jgi:hypothetical protein
VKSRITIRIKVIIQKLYMLKTEPWTVTMEALRLKMVPWSVYRKMVADSLNFDEEQDPDPHSSKKLNPDRHEIENAGSGSALQ